MLRTFDPSLHPRDRTGKFSQILGALRRGDSVAVKGGGTVTRSGKGFRVRTRAGKVVDAPDAGAAARLAHGDVAGRPLGAGGFSGQGNAGSGPGGVPTRADMAKATGSKLAEPGSPGRPVRTASVEEAAHALADGKYVELTSPDEVAVLLPRLKEYVDNARAKGEKAPNFNLCKVTVKGTSLFCVNSKGIPRIKMPQLKGDKPRPGSRADKLSRDSRGEVSIEKQFRDSLSARGVKVEDDTELASHLKATQNELNGAKVAGIANAMDRGVKIEGPGLFVSKDNYIVDGHHRWAATVGVDWEDGKADIKMPVQRIDLPIIDVLMEANKFAEEWGLPQAGLGDFSPKMLGGSPKVAKKPSMEFYDPKKGPSKAQMAANAVRMGKRPKP